MGSRWQVEKKHDPYYKRAKSENTTHSTIKTGPMVINIFENE